MNGLLGCEKEKLRENEQERAVASGKNLTIFFSGTQIEGRSWDPVYADQHQSDQYKFGRVKLEFLETHGGSATNYDMVNKDIPCAELLHASRFYCDYT